VLEQQIDARLELGDHAEVVPELERLIAEHPLRERLRGQLILALYRSGRQAEALETYRETRRVLVEELGIEPSPELRELERAILRQDGALASAAVQSEAKPVEPRPSSRWRWPRSPLVAGAVVLLLLTGVAVAILATPRSGTPHAGAAQPPATSVLTVTSRSTSTAAQNGKHGKSGASHHQTRPARPQGEPSRPRSQPQGKAA
jgi:Bacterial transcriptional activator domain